MAQDGPRATRTRRRAAEPANRSWRLLGALETKRPGTIRSGAASGRPLRVAERPAALEGGTSRGPSLFPKAPEKYHWSLMEQVSISPSPSIVPGKILSANSRQGSIGRGLGKRDIPAKENPGFPAIETNSTTVSGFSELRGRADALACRPPEGQTHDLTNGPNGHHPGILTRATGSGSPRDDRRRAPNPRL
jgi:hypothetical protein